MSTNETTILMLADANPRAAIATLRALKGSDVSIHLCFNKRSIINDTIYHKYYKSEPLYYDKTSEKTFIDSLLSIKDIIGEYVFLPYGESLLRWVVRQKDELWEDGITVPTVDFETYVLLSDKESFANLCGDFDIDVPEEINIDWSTFKQKFVIKPKKLVNDERCLKYPVLVENNTSFQKLKETNIDIEKHLVQRYIDGPSIYYCAYWEKGNCKLRFIQKNTVQQPAGKSVVRAVPYNLPEEVLGKIEKMLHSVNWRGLIMIEVKKDLDSHKYYAIEANPRFWGPLQIAIDNGINFPAALLGLDVRENKPKKPSGYLWLGGYINGFFIKLQTKTDFQVFQNGNSEKMVYRDIWLRRDTYVFFFIDPFISIINGIASLVGEVFRRIIDSLRLFARQ